MLTHASSIYSRISDVFNTIIKIIHKTYLRHVNMFMCVIRHKQIKLIKRKRQTHSN